MKEVKCITEMCCIDVTYGCNFRCKHCYNSSGEHSFGGKELSDEELMGLIDELIILNPRVLCFCGGETLLRKDIILKMAKKFTTATGNQCNMVSNGYLVTPELALEIKESGIKLVQISLDGASAETHNWLRNNNESFEKAINALKILKTAGLSTSVACTPTKKNIQEVYEIIDLCASLGVSSFRMQPLMKMGRASSMDDFFLESYDYFKLHRLLIKRESDFKVDQFSIEWGDPLQHLANYAEGQTRFNMIVISAYGDITVSPYLPITVGNIRRHSLQDYVNNGFADIIQNEFFLKVCKLLQNSSEMDISSISQLPPVFAGKDIIMDVFDGDIKNLGKKLIDDYNL